jgi:hypothetical protein
LTTSSPAGSPGLRSRWPRSGCDRGWASICLESGRCAGGAGIRSSRPRMLPGRHGCRVWLGGTAVDRGARDAGSRAGGGAGPVGADRCGFTSPSFSSSMGSSVNGKGGGTVVAGALAIGAPAGGRNGEPPPAGPTRGKLGGADAACGECCAPALLAALVLGPTPAG